ncbi:MAG: hypothetical protein M3329_07405 [Pseudomonadota bacterium]|nr:hypothetical protein [Pseudomonadota bacterium]
MLDAATLPLLGLRNAAAHVVRRRNGAVSRSVCLAQVRRLAQDLPRSPYVVNLCEDFALFLVAFAAVIARGKASLLPPTPGSGEHPCDVSG